MTDEGAYLRLGEELCSSVSSLSLESRQTMSALTYCCQLVDAFSSVLHCILPYRNLAQDLALSVRWSEDLFSTTLFKIQYSIIRLCLEQGVSSETLLFHCPLNNLFQLITVLRAQKVFCFCFSGTRIFDPCAFGATPFKGWKKAAKKSDAT